MINEINFFVGFFLNFLNLKYFISRIFFRSLVTLCFGCIFIFFLRPIRPAAGRRRGYTLLFVETN